MAAKSSRHLVDAELLPLLDVIPAVPLSIETLARVRATPRSLGSPDPSIAAKVVKRKHIIPGKNGDPDVALFSYLPVGAAGPLPCAFHMHGGGYVLGSVEALEALLLPVVVGVGCALISVDYRLGPEHPFPAAINDCYAGLSWVFEHARELGVDTARIGLKGESAGGGLAASLALLTRDRGEHSLAFQHLTYPMIDDRTGVTKDQQPYAGEFIWPPQSNAFGWASLLGQAPGVADVSPYAAAARAETLEGLPQTFMATGALDLFIEENLDYARRLLQAGVPVELHVYPGAFHGFNLVPDAAVARQARRDSDAALKRFMSL